MLLVFCYLSQKKKKTNPLFVYNPIMCVPLFKNDNSDKCSIKSLAILKRVIAQVAVVLPSVNLKDVSVVQNQYRL
jgi:hypothetical protein